MLAEPVLPIVVGRVAHDHVVVIGVLAVVLDQDAGAVHAVVELAVGIDGATP